MKDISGMSGSFQARSEGISSEEGDVDELVDLLKRTASFSFRPIGRFGGNNSLDKQMVVL